MIIFCLFVTAIFMIPTMDGMLRIGADTTFHVNRIIGLANAIENNDFFPKILFNQNYNFGYGSPMFYSIFIYIHLHYFIIQEKHHMKYIVLLYL